MKHTAKITVILLLMFLVTQLIGLYVVNFYIAGSVPVDGLPVNITDVKELPFGLESPEIQEPQEFNQVFISMVIAFVIAISLLLFLMHFKAEIFLKLWFLAVIIIAIGISLNTVIPGKNAAVIAIAVAIPLAYLKLFRRNLLVHNLTELIVYPGIAAVFVPILNFFTVALLLLLISIYDMWAVWHSGVMQKMAKYQINTLKVFGGFFVPYMSKKDKIKIQEMKEKAKTKKGATKAAKKKVSVNVAILGGGDIIFPIIAAGVMLKSFGFVTLGTTPVPIASLLVILGASFGLAYLFLSAEKKKFYPAMPFITAGIFLGMALSWIVYTKILGIPLSIWPIF